MKVGIALALSLATAASAQERATVTVTGARALDGRGRAIENARVTIEGARIVSIESAAAGPATYGLGAVTLLPGLIDTHAHVFQFVTGRFGLNADMVGVRSGVTTLVDQGGPSCMTLPGFRHFIVEPAKSRVLCFISMYLVGGMEGHLYPALYGPEQVDVKATIRAGRA